MFSWKASLKLLDEAAGGDFAKRCVRFASKDLPEIASGESCMPTRLPGHFATCPNSVAIHTLTLRRGQGTSLLSQDRH